jgi:probable HAF family extracellular repeat protein
MNGIKTRLLPAIILAVGGAFAAQAQAAPQRYNVRILEPLAGFENSWAPAINGKGQVVLNSYTLGFDESSSDFKAALWTNGVVKPVPVAAAFTAAFDINYSGWMAGDSFNQAVIFKGGSVVSIKTGWTESWAEGINNRGNVIGSTWNYVEQIGGLFLYKDGVVTDLRKKGLWSAASINDRDQVAGTCYKTLPDGNNKYTACIYENGRARLLTKGGLRDASSANDINLAGHVIGNYTRPGTSRDRGFLHTNGGVTDLGYTEPKDINNAGTIVGVSPPSWEARPTKAFIRVGGKNYDLNKLTDGLGTFVLESAAQINERGEIVGTGRASGAGPYRAFLLRPVAAASESAPE